jgi:integral membrane protein
MAYVTGVVLATMVVFAVPIRLVMGGQPPTWYVIGWTGHGWLYILYVITVIDLASRARFPLLRTLLVMLAGTVPFMSFVAEHYVTKDVRARLDAAQATPSAARSSATGSSSG